MSLSVAPLCVRARMPRCAHVPVCVRRAAFVHFFGIFCSWLAGPHVCFADISYTMLIYVHLAGVGVAGSVRVTIGVHLIGCDSRSPSRPLRGRGDPPQSVPAPAPCVSDDHCVSSAVDRSVCLPLSFFLSFSLLIHLTRCLLLSFFDARRRRHLYIAAAPHGTAGTPHHKLNLAVVSRPPASLPVSLVHQTRSCFSRSKCRSSRLSRLLSS